MKRKKRILVICNGEPPSPQFLRRLARGADFIVAADGGANTARACGLRPDLIIGDLDSVTAATLRQFRTSIILRVSRQDNTDLEKTLDYVAGGGKGEVVIVGATGGRVDFTLANLAVIWNYTRILDISVRGNGWRAMPVGRSYVGRAAIGTTVSLIPFGRCTGITLRGLRFPLTNAAMEVGAIGVSNSVRRSPFSVNVKMGKMLLLLLDRPHRARRAGP